MTVEPIGTCSRRQKAASSPRGWSRLGYELSRSTVRDGTLRHVCALVSAVPAVAL